MSDRLRRAAVEAHLRTHWVAREFHYRQRTTSTMDEARAAALRGAPAGAVFVAEEQTVGRGTHGRGWVSPAGQNLHFTILLRPLAAKLGRLAMVTPVAVANGVEQLTGIFPRIKWPNDLQLSGKKFAGILIEAEWEASKPLFALVGVGLNVNFDPTAYGAAIDQPATSLALERGRPLAREPLLAAVLNAFERAYEGAESEALFAGWRSRLQTLGRSVVVTTGDGRRYEGVAEEVGGDGALVVRLTDGTRMPFHAGEVSLRRAEPLPA